MQIVNKDISIEEKFLVDVLFIERKSLDTEIDLKKTWVPSSHDTHAKEAPVFFQMSTQSIFGW